MYLSFALKNDPKYPCAVFVEDLVLYLFICFFLLKLLIPVVFFPIFHVFKVRNYMASVNLFFYIK